MKANLFIAGACKSGTTYLHHFLGQQQDICPSKPKEPYFFELNDQLRDSNRYISKYFNQYKNEKYLMDGRHRTMFFQWIPRALKNYNDEAKLIFILRDPIDRAYSHWWMWYSRNIIKLSFYKTIKQQYIAHQKGLSFMNMTPTSYMQFVNNKVPQKRMTYADMYTIVESGFYYEQIKEFYNLFNAENILVLDYNNLNDKMYLGNKLSQFLGVDIRNTEKSEVKNESKKHISRNFWVSKFLPKSIKDRVKHFLFSKPKMKPKSIKLLKEIYANHDKKLVTEFGLRFVDNWKSQQ